MKFSRLYDVSVHHSAELPVSNAMSFMKGRHDRGDRCVINRPIGSICYRKHDCALCVEALLSGNVPRDSRDDRKLYSYEWRIWASINWLHGFISAHCIMRQYDMKQESLAVARKPRDAAAVRFSFKFVDIIHYKFNVSQASKARLQSSKHTGGKTEFNAK